jgi:hypothetical protein
MKQLRTMATRRLRHSSERRLVLLLGTARPEMRQQVRHTRPFSLDSPERTARNAHPIGESLCAAAFA